MDRERLLLVLRRRFRGASVQQFAEAANAIMALPEEWEEVREDIRSLAEHVQDGLELRIFRKRRYNSTRGPQGRRRPIVVH